MSCGGSQRAFAHAAVSRLFRRNMGFAGTSGGDGPSWRRSGYVDGEAVLERRLYAFLGVSGALTPPTSLTFCA